MARRLGVHQGTVFRRIADGDIVPDAYVGPRPLFLDVQDEAPTAVLEVVEPSLTAPHLLPAPGLPVSLELRPDTANALLVDNANRSVRSENDNLTPPGPQPNGDLSIGRMLSGTEVLEPERTSSLPDESLLLLPTDESRAFKPSPRDKRGFRGRVTPCKQGISQSHALNVADPTSPLADGGTR